MNINVESVLYLMDHLMTMKLVVYCWFNHMTKWCVCVYM
jgi:hypothetical protein